MPEIDWDAFRNNVSSVAREAAETTNDKLAGQISSVTRLTDSEVKELFPEPADVKKLADLMAIVKSAEDRNTKVNNLVDNAQNFGSVLFTLIDKFV